MSLLKHQLWHFILLLILLVAMFLIVDSDLSFTEGQFWGINSISWFWVAILAPILHQVYVLICWRLELLKKSISKRFGAKGFKLYKIGFAILILSRFIAIILLALSNANTSSISPTLSYLLALVLLIPDSFFQDLEQLSIYLNESFDYVMSLKPK